MSSVQLKKKTKQKEMTQKEVMDEMTVQWMHNEEASRVFDFEVGASFDAVFPKASIVRLLMWVCSGVIALKETLLGEWKREVEQVALATHYGTAQWWVEAVKRWQPGDVLDVIDGRVGYAEEDAGRRVVTAASVTAEGRTLLLKVAKGDVGHREPLTTDELEGLRGYVDAVKPLGIMAKVISGPANRVSVGGVVRYRSEMDEQTVRDAVKQAVEKACDGLSFNGTLYAGRLTMAVMSVDGVVDANLGGLQIDGVDWTDSVVPTSGYVEFGGEELEFVKVF